MAIIRHPLRSGFGLFQALSPATHRYDPRLLHAIAERKPEAIEFRLTHFSDLKTAENSEGEHLSLHQLNRLEQYAQGLLDKPFELAIALHNAEETTEKNSYFCIRVLALNFDKLEKHARHFNYPEPDLRKILTRAAENSDPFLLDFVLNIFAENTQNTELHERAVAIAEELRSAPKPSTYF